MKEREFRELQVSSAQLAIIFLGILVLGVVIFLLGVSVGKRHAQEAEKATLAVTKEPEALKDKVVTPEVIPPTGQPTPKIAPQEKLQAKKEAVPEAKQPLLDTQKLKAQEKTSAPIASPPPQKDLYYVQVGALIEKPAALALAEQFKNQGYPVVVLDPLPTDRTPYYRVRIGGFATKAEAEATKNKLGAGSGRKDYFIVRD